MLFIGVVPLCLLSLTPVKAPYNRGIKTKSYLSNRGEPNSHPCFSSVMMSLSNRGDTSLREGILSDTTPVKCSYLLKFKSHAKIDACLFALFFRGFPITGCILS